MTRLKSKWVNGVRIDLLLYNGPPTRYILKAYFEDDSRLAAVSMEWFDSFQNAEDFIERLAGRHEENWPRSFSLFY